MSDYFNFSSSPMIPSTNLGNAGMFQSMGGKNPFSLPSSGAVTNKKETNSQNFVQRFLGNLKKNFNPQGVADAAALGSLGTPLAPIGAAYGAHRYLTSEGAGEGDYTKPGFFFGLGPRQHMSKEERAEVDAKTKQTERDDWRFKIEQDKEKERAWANSPEGRKEMMDMWNKAQDKQMWRGVVCKNLGNLGSTLAAGQWAVAEANRGIAEQATRAGAHLPDMAAAVQSYQPRGRTSYYSGGGQKKALGS